MSALMPRKTMVASIIAAFSLASCSTATQSMTVGQLMANPDASDNREVYVQGCYLYEKDSVSALADECPASLSWDYRPYGNSAIDLVASDQSGAYAGQYVLVSGVFRRYGRNHGNPVFNLRGVSDVGQIEISRMKEQANH
jgi:hypothetical protein